jgi:hypothetical protein
VNDRTVADLVDHLNRQREVLRSAVARVPAHQREQKPAPDRWSVAEVLEHLAIVEMRVAGLLSAAVHQAPEQANAASAGAATMAEQQLNRLVDRSTRRQTSEAGTPSGQFDAQAAWAMLESARQHLLDVLNAARGRDLSEVRRPHPLLGELNGWEWIAFIGGHDARHAAQIDEVGAALASARAP